VHPYYIAMHIYTNHWLQSFIKLVPAATILPLVAVQAIKEIYIYMHECDNYTASYCSTYIITVQEKSLKEENLYLLKHATTCDKIFTLHIENLKLPRMIKN